MLLDNFLFVLGLAGIAIFAVCCLGAAAAAFCGGLKWLGLI